MYHPKVIGTENNAFTVDILLAISRFDLCPNFSKELITLRNRTMMKQKCSIFKDECCKSEINFVYSLVVEGQLLVGIGKPPKSKIPLYRISFILP